MSSWIFTRIMREKEGSGNQKSRSRSQTRPSFHQLVLKLKFYSLVIHQTSSNLAPSQNTFNIQDAFKWLNTQGIDSEEAEVFITKWEQDGDFSPVDPFLPFSFNPSLILRISSYWVSHFRDIESVVHLKKGPKWSNASKTPSCFLIEWGGTQNNLKLRQYIFDKESVVSIAGAGNHAVAVTRSGNVCVWGKQTRGLGELGLGDRPIVISSPYPLQFPSGNIRFKQVTCGPLSTAAISLSGREIFMWGASCGRGSPLTRPTLFCQVNSTWRVRQVALGLDSALLLLTKSDGESELYSWGRNRNLQGRDPTFQEIDTTITGSPFLSLISPLHDFSPHEPLFYDIPRIVTPLSGIIVTHISCSDTHSCAVTSTGDVFIWGMNLEAQIEDHSPLLGAGVNDPVIYAPHKVMGFRKAGGEKERIVVALCGVRYTIALSEEGDVYSWGDGRGGYLGLGEDRVYSEFPSLLPNIKDVELLATSSRHNIALTQNKTLVSWGRGGSYRLGDPHSNTDKYSPHQISFPCAKEKHSSSSGHSQGDTQEAFDMGIETRESNFSKPENIFGIACCNHQTMILGADGQFLLCCCGIAVLLPSSSVDTVQSLIEYAQSHLEILFLHGFDDSSFSLTPSSPEDARHSFTYQSNTPPISTSSPPKSSPIIGATKSNPLPVESRGLSNSWSTLSGPDLNPSPSSSSISPSFTLSTSQAMKSNRMRSLSTQPTGKSRFSPNPSVQDPSFNDPSLQVNSGPLLGEPSFSSIDLAPSSFTAERKTLPCPSRHSPVHSAPPPVHLSPLFFGSTLVYDPTFTLRSPAESVAQIVCDICRNGSRPILYVVSPLSFLAPTIPVTSDTPSPSPKSPFLLGEMVDDIVLSIDKQLVMEASVDRILDLAFFPVEEGNGIFADFDVFLSTHTIFPDLDPPSYFLLFYPTLKLTSRELLKTLQRKFFEGGPKGTHYFGQFEREGVQAEIAKKFAEQASLIRMKKIFSFMSQWLQLFPKDIYNQGYIAVHECTQFLLKVMFNDGYTKELRDTGAEILRRFLFSKCTNFESSEESPLRSSPPLSPVASPQATSISQPSLPQGPLSPRSQKSPMARSLHLSPLQRRPAIDSLDRKKHSSDTSTQTSPGFRPLPPPSCPVSPTPIRPSPAFAPLSSSPRPVSPSFSVQKVSPSLSPSTSPHPSPPPSPSPSPSIGSPQKQSKLRYPTGFVRVTVPSLTSIPPSVSAEQISLLDHSIFCQLHPRELIDHAWTGRTKEKDAPTVCLLTKRFNSLANFISKTILLAPDHGTRVQTTEYFIETANHLHGLNNLFSCCAITAAFLQSPIHRLKKIWKGKECISLKHQQMFESLKRTNDLVGKTEGKEFRVLYEDTQRTQPISHLTFQNLGYPKIPYIGVYLNHLVFQADKASRSSVNSSGVVLINVARIRRLSSIIFNFLQIKQHSYSFRVNPDAQNFWSTERVKGFETEESKPDFHESVAYRISRAITSYELQPETLKGEVERILSEIPPKGSKQEEKSESPKKEEKRCLDLYLMLARTIVGVRRKEEQIQLFNWWQGEIQMIPKCGLNSENKRRDGTQIWSSIFEVSNSSQDPSFEGSRKSGSSFLSHVEKNCSLSPLLSYFLSSSLSSIDFLSTISSEKIESLFESLPLSGCETFIDLLRDSSSLHHLILYLMERKEDSSHEIKWVAWFLKRLMPLECQPEIFLSSVTFLQCHFSSLSSPLVSSLLEIVDIYVSLRRYPLSELNSMKSVIQNKSLAQILELQKCERKASQVMGEAPKTHLTIPLEGDQQPTESDETFPEVGQAGVWDTIEELDNSSWTFCSQFWALFSQVGQHALRIRAINEKLEKVDATELSKQISQLEALRHLSQTKGHLSQILEAVDVVSQMKKALDEEILALEDKKKESKFQSDQALFSLSNFSLSSSSLLFPQIPSIMPPQAAGTSVATKTINSPVISALNAPNSSISSITMQISNSPPTGSNQPEPSTFSTSPPSQLSSASLSSSSSPSSLSGSLSSSTSLSSSSSPSSYSTVFSSQPPALPLSSFSTFLSPAGSPSTLRPRSPSAFTSSTTISQPTDPLSSSQTFSSSLPPESSVLSQSSLSSKPLFLTPSTLQSTTSSSPVSTTSFTKGATPRTGKRIVTSASLLATHAFAQRFKESCQSMSTRGRENLLSQYLRNIYYPVCDHVSRLSEFVSLEYQGLFRYFEFSVRVSIKMSIRCLQVIESLSAPLQTMFIACGWNQNLFPFIERMAKCINSCLKKYFELQKLIQVVDQQIFDQTKPSDSVTLDLAKLSSTLSYAISLFGALTNPFCEKEEQRNKPKRGWLGETFSREITEKCLFGSPQPSTSLDEKDFLGIVEQFETRIGTLKKITNKRGEGVSSPGRTRACSSPQTGPTRSSPSQTVPPQKSLKKINQQEQTTPSMSKLLEQDLFFGGPPEKQNTNPLHKSSEGHPLEVQKVSSLMRIKTIQKGDLRTRGTKEDLQRKGESRTFRKKEKSVRGNADEYMF